MKRRNSAGKTNARRITAASRLENAIKIEMTNQEPSMEKIEKLKSELEHLLVKIVNPELARARRTKKTRHPDKWDSVNRKSKV